MAERFPPDAPGGGGVSSSLLARALAGGNKVTVVTSGDGKIEKGDGVRIARVIPKIGGFLPEELRRGELLTVTTMAKLMEFLERADIVHIHSMKTAIGSLLASRLNGVPIVATVNDTWATCYFTRHFRDGKVCETCSPGLLMRCLRLHGGQPAIFPYLLYQMKCRFYFLSKFDGLMPHSNLIARVLRKNGMDVPMEVIPGIIDTGILKKSELPLTGTIGFVGRIDEGKGIDDALRAAAAAGCNIRIVGSGPEIERYKKMARDLDLGGRAVFTGRVPYEDISNEYMKMDLVIAPFTRIEPLGRVVLEAMACGRGVITTPLCGSVKRIEEGVNGFLCEPGDYHSMAGRISELFTDPERLRRLGEAGRAIIEREHSPEAIRRRVLNFYDRIFKRRKR